jgi:hypothetical protein
MLASGLERGVGGASIVGKCGLLARRAGQPMHWAKAGRTSRYRRAGLIKRRLGVVTPLIRY